MSSSSSETASATPLESTPHPGVSFREFVIYIAFCMAINALAIDIMLPALPDIGQALAVSDANHTQAIIIVYLLGVGVSQLLFGPLADALGRKPVMLAGLSIFLLATLICTLTENFTLMLLARLLQGIGAGAPRVLTISMVRDSYRGAYMGKVMSLALMIFMAIPILAPSLGQLILWIAPWRTLFIVLLLAGMLLLLWTHWRIPETLRPAHRRSFRLNVIATGYAEVLKHRQSMVYTLAMAAITGSLFGFLSSAQQIFVEVFEQKETFTLLFALIALCMSIAAFVNSRLVVRLGLQRLSHGALAGFWLVNLVFVLLAANSLISLPGFMLIQGLSLFLFGFIGSNFNSLAMDPLGHLAGTASSCIGFMTTTGGAVIGFAIGQHFDGSVLPLAIGNAILATLAGALLLWHLHTSEQH
ncbi:multidrug effflux MFS transporter [Balneatrix alpica]|uniref:multidrug effflux MFS transporter n=1 Tax=Balneatrix alpica TaxID=75684 RepID=UPI0027394AD1|nr:multidrug effflux MFS transporter [Balneatrix alpica]